MNFLIPDDKNPNDITETVDQIKKDLMLIRDYHVVLKKQYVNKILDIINRLKSELFEKTEQLETAKEENENFKMVLEAVEDHIHPLPFETDFDKAIKQAKAEAYKECIEKVYKFICDTKNWGVLHREFLENGECYWLKQKFDNLLKELVGEDK